MKRVHYLGLGGLLLAVFTSPPATSRVAAGTPSIVWTDDPLGRGTVCVQLQLADSPWFALLTPGGLYSSNALDSVSFNGVKGKFKDSTGIKLGGSPVVGKLSGSFKVNGKGKAKLTDTTNKQNKLKFTIENSSATLINNDICD